MPYRVYEASEFEALVSPEEAGAAGPRATRVQEALNSLETEGYRLVGVDSSTEGDALYVFHRDDPHERLSNMR